MPLTPLTDGMTGLDCRTNINASFTQVDANVTAIAARLPLTGGALTGAVAVPVAAGYTLANARANGFVIGASLAAADVGFSSVTGELNIFVNGQGSVFHNIFSFRFDSNVWLGWAAAAPSGGPRTELSGALADNTLQIGKASATPSDQTFKGPNGSGTNIAAGDLSLAAGQSTGNATPALLRLKGTGSGSSGAAEQSLSDHLLIGSELVEVEAGIVFQLGNEAVAESPSATHTLIIKDSTGTAYKVLCVPV